MKDLKKTTQSINKINGSNNNKITDEYHVEMWNKLIWREKKRRFGGVVSILQQCKKNEWKLKRQS